MMAFGTMLAIVGALLLYLASPNQRATARALPGTALAVAGGAVLALSLAALLRWAGPATAVFIWFTIAMMVWTLAPPAAAWLRRPKQAAR